MTEAPLVRRGMKEGMNQSAPGDPASETPANESRGPGSRVTGIIKSRLFSRVTARFFCWFLGLALIPMVILVAVSLNRTGTAIHDEALRRLMQVASDRHDRVEEYIHQIKQAIQHAGSDPYARTVLETASQSPVRIGDSLTGRWRGEVQPIFGPEPEMSILDRFGRVVVSTEPRLMGSDRSRTDYFLKGRKATLLTDIFYDTLTQRMTWMASSPVAGDDGTVLGVIVNQIDPRRLTSITNSRKPERNDGADDTQPGFKGRVYLVNRDGLLLTDAPSFPDSPFHQVVDTKPVRYARDTKKRMYGDYPDIRRTKVAGASEVIADCGWVVIAEMDYEQAMAPYVRFRNGILILSLAVFALMFVLVVRLGAIVARPLRTLILAEERSVPEGQPAVLVPEDQIPDDEIGELMRRRNEVIRRILATEQRHRDLVDEIDGIAWEADVGTWRFTFVNRRAEKILGYPVEQWLSEPGFWVGHLHSLDRSRTVQAFLETSITGKSLQLEYRMIASDGHAVWLRDHAHIVEGAAFTDGRPARQLHGLMIDITAAKKAQELLQESERRSRTIVDMSRDAVVGVDSKGNVSVFNHAAEQMFRIPAREMIGTSPARLVPEDLRDRHLKAISRFLETGRPNGVIGQPRELRGLRSDGSVFPIEICLTPTNDKSIRVLASIQDITARMKAEEELRRGYQQIEGLHNLTDAVMRAETVEEICAQAVSCAKLALQADRTSIVLSDPDGSMRFRAGDRLSDEYQTVTEGLRIWNEDGPDPRPLVLADVQSPTAQEASQSTILSPSDTKRLLSLISGEGIRALSAIPLIYQGRILGRLMVYFDTPHKFTEEEIQLAQTIAAHVAFAIGRQRASDVLRAIVDGTSQSTGAEFFRILVRHLANALHVRWAFVGETVGAGRNRIRTLALWAGSDYAPDFEYDLAGTPCEGVMGRAMCCYPRDVARTFAQDHLLVELGVEGYIGVRLSDSSGNSLGILVVMNDTPIHEPSQVQSILSVFAARASAELERLQTEQRLEREQQWYRSLTEQIGEAFFICDADTGRMIEANPVLQTLLGYTRDELLSMTLYEIRCDDPATVGRYIQDHIRGPHHTLRRIRYRHKDGTPVDVETSTNLFVSDQQRALFVLVRFADREAVRLVSNAAQGRDCSPVGAMFDSDVD